MVHVSMKEKILVGLVYVRVRIRHTLYLWSHEIYEYGIS